MSTPQPEARTEPCKCPEGFCTCDSGLLTGQTDPDFRRRVKVLSRDLRAKYGNRKEAGDGRPRP